MPIVNYPMLPRPISPLSGIEEGQRIGKNFVMIPQELRAKQLANAIQGVKAKYAEPLTKQQLQHAILQNLHQQQENTRYGQMTPLEVQKAKLFNEYYAPNQIANINQKTANTNLTNLRSKYLPLDKLIQAANLSRLSERFGKSYQLSQMLHNMDESSRLLWISQNPESYNQMLTDMANATNQPQNYGLQNALASYFPQLKPNNALSTQNNPQSNIDYASQITPTTNTPSFNQPSPKNTENLAANLALQANKKASTNQTNERAESAVAMERYLFDNRDKLEISLRNASKYSGIYGKFILQNLDKIKSSDPEAYNDFLWYGESFLPAMSNHIKLMEGLSSSNRQREELHNLLGALKKWNIDPINAIKLFNKQIGTIQDTSDSVFRSAEPSSKGAYRKSYGLNRIKGDFIKDLPNSKENSSRIITKEDYDQAIKDNMKKYNVSEQVARQAMKDQGYSYED